MLHFETENFKYAELFKTNIENFTYPTESEDLIFKKWEVMHEVATADTCDVHWGPCRSWSDTGSQDPHQCNWKFQIAKFQLPGPI